MNSARKEVVAQLHGLRFNHRQIAVAVGASHQTVGWSRWTKKWSKCATFPQRMPTSRHNAEISLRTSSSELAPLVLTQPDDVFLYRNVPSGHDYLPRESRGKGITIAANPKPSQFW